MLGSAGTAARIPDRNRRAREELDMVDAFVVGRDVFRLASAERHRLGRACLIPGSVAAECIGGADGFATTRTCACDAACVVAERSEVARYFGAATLLQGKVQTW